LDTVSLESQTEPQTPVQEKTDWKHVLLDLLETVGLAVVLFLVINALSARVRVDGFSMLPTLHDGEFVLVNKLAYHTGSPTRGDIIVFRSVDPRSNQDLIKRVIGLPGDMIAIRSGKVIVNGQALDEPYIAAAPNYNGEWPPVPQDDLFVLGDNRNDSSDSHAWGFLPIQNVVGKALLIYWPPNEWAMVDHIKIEAPAP
jgi:signal peptidase I